MTNKLATVQVSASYSDPDNQRAAIARVVVDAPYQAQIHQAVDVPDTTAGATEYDLSFGTITEEATMFVVRNLTANGEDPGQDLILKINASAALQRIPPGGFVAVGNPVVAGATPITAVSVTTTATQNGPGKISWHVFGDPT